MKKFIILLGIAISISASLAQNNIDPLKIENYTDTTVFDRNWNNTHFIKGWNWGNPGRWLDEALGMNYYHDDYAKQRFGSSWDDNQYSITDSNLFVRNHRKLAYLPGLVGGYDAQTLFNAQVIILNPTINVDSTNNFIPRAYDSSGSVFGFYFKRKVRILDSSQHSNSNYHFALLDKDSVLVGSDTVLKNAWNPNALHYLNYWKKGEFLTQPVYNGAELYLTVNLKSRDTITTSFLNDTILKIRIPYTLNDASTGFIKFDSVATDSVSSIRNVDTIYNEDRGRYKLLHPTDAPKPTEFCITGQMLKFSNANPADSSLTLSAFFFCDGQTTIGRNQYLFAEGTYLTPFINKMDVEVIYYGKINLGIKYIKIECPRAQKIFRGFYDDTLRMEMDTLKSLIRGNNNGVRVHRIYGDDEVFPRGWAAMRYFNMCLDTIAALETFTWASWGLGVHLNLPAQLLYATGFKEFYNGSTLCFDNDRSAPFIKFGLDTNMAKYFNLRCGRQGFTHQAYPPGSRYFSDTLESEYETWLNGPDKTTLPYSNTSYYDSIWCETCTHWNFFFSTQNYLEFQLYNSFYKYLPLIYNKKPWWANIWLMGAANYDSSISSFTFTGQRAHTGEETRLFINNSLILGAKGLIYWYKNSIGDIYGDGQLFGFQDDTISHNLRGDNLLKSDSLGGDFVNVVNDPNNLHRYFSPDGYKWDSLGINQNRIYLGLKTTRTEVSKIHKWIDKVEDKLLSLRLIAWLGKGYVKLYSQDSEIGVNDIITKFIDTSRINLFTKKIWNPTTNTIQYQRENWDSSFFDLTLLRNKNDDTLTSVFYVGVVNRRTDPLIKTTDTIICTIDDGWGYVTRDTTVNTGI